MRNYAAMLIRCPDCGSEVSDTAVACPKCAYDFTRWYRLRQAQEREDRSEAIAGGVSRFVSWAAIVFALWVGGVNVYIATHYYPACWIVVVVCIAGLIAGIVGLNRANERFPRG